MPRAAVICEFNPFHNGHLFLLEKIKREYADEIICIMSGNFVQRGELAITDKYERTKAALSHGADMVVELPTVYAVSSARTFADNGVKLAHELGCELLCFGAENSILELNDALQQMDLPKTQEKIAALIKDGCSYPRALSQALVAPYSDIIAGPNNILAIEYIRASRQYEMIPIAIPREGVDHDSDLVSGRYASASKIREMILNGEDYLSYTPCCVASYAAAGALVSVILYRLKTASAEELAALPEVSEGLENRLKEAASQEATLRDILTAVKTKRYTMARLKRIAVYALLGITKQMQATPVPYIRVLGIKEQSRNLISSHTLPLIVDVRRGFNSLNNSAKEIFSIDLRAAEAMNIARKTTVNEFAHGLIIASESK